MTVQQVVDERNIQEVVHFTTHQGLLGILYSKAIKSRQSVEQDGDLSYILTPNAAMRRDTTWVDYVNLSISRINSHYFRCSCRWHRETGLWWCILALDPEVLAHEGVVFTTTNNIYTGVRRGRGPAAIEAMFADRVVRWSGNVVARTPDLPSHFTTCEQAEVLYRHEVSTNYLRGIYVSTPEDQDDVCGQLEAVSHPPVPVVVDPDRFGFGLGVAI